MPHKPTFDDLKAELDKRGMQLNSYFTSFGDVSCILELKHDDGRDTGDITINTNPGGVDENYTIQIELPNSGRSAADDAEYLRGIFFPNGPLKGKI